MFFFSTNNKKNKKREKEFSINKIALEYNIEKKVCEIKF